MSKKGGNPQNLRPIPKGVVLNPGGRKPIPQEVKDILAAATPKAARALVDLIDSRDPKIRLRASELVLDRVYGKATQAVDVHVTDVAKVHMQALQEIEARRKARLEGRKVVEDAQLIDVTPTVEDNFDDLC